MALVVCLFMLFVGVFVPSQGEARRRVWGAVCAQRMQEWSSALISYSFDNRDALPTFTWRAGQPGVPGAGIGEPKANLRAVQAQALAMVRRFAGRDDITAPDDWLPQPHFTWLVLHEAGQRNVLKTVKCPEDRRGSLVELNWQRQGGPAPSISEFASTFEFVPATWSPNATLIYSDGKVLPIVEPGPREGEYRVPEGRPFGLKPRRTDEVAFPDRKVILFDPFDRHSASKKRHYAHPDAEQTLLMADGSVRRQRTADANPGGLPNDPTGKAVPRFDSQPVVDPWEIRTDNVREVRGYYRWTASGLKGADFNSPQVVRSPFARPTDTVEWSIARSLP